VTADIYQVFTKILPHLKCVAALHCNTIWCLLTHDGLFFRLTTERRFLFRPRLCISLHVIIRISCRVNKMFVYDCSSIFVVFILLVDVCIASVPEKN